MRKINIYTAIMGFIKSFIASCGISLLLLFFYGEEIPLSKGLVRNSVLIIFSMLIMFQVIIDVFVNKDYCSCNNIEPPSGKAISNTATNVSECSKKIFRIHEAGHAVMAYLQEVEDFEIDMSSYISPKTITQYISIEVDDVKKRILVGYSGAVAEELLLGHFCAGSMGNSESDFPSTTEWIKAYIVMTDSTVSKTLLNEELSDRIIAVSNALYQEAKDLLSENKEMIEVIANELENKDSLNKCEIVQLLSTINKNERR